MHRDRSFKDQNQSRSGPTPWKDSLVKFCNGVSIVQFTKATELSIRLKFRSIKETIIICENCNSTFLFIKSTTSR